MTLRPDTPIPRRWIDAETLEQAIGTAEVLYATSRNEDVQLVVGVFLQLLSQARPNAELRTDTEWIPVPAIERRPIVG